MNSSNNQILKLQIKDLFQILNKNINQFSIFSYHEDGEIILPDFQTFKVKFSKLSKSATNKNKIAKFLLFLDVFSMTILFG